MKKILFAMHMPPPYHGASMVGQRLHEHKGLNKIFQCEYVNISLATSLNDIGGARFSKLQKYVHLLYKISKQTKKFKPDLCYITPNAAGKQFFLNLLMIICAMRDGTKIVLHYHNKGVEKYQQKWLYNICYKFLFRRVHVILLSERLYYDVEKYIKKDMVFYSLMGIPNKPLQAVRKSTPAVFSFISNLIPSKGIYELLDACEILKKEGNEFCCEIAGGETKEISSDKLDEEIKKRGLKGICTYHGRVSEEEKEKLLLHSHCFVFPTYYKNECFPAAILEAMRAGVAVISTYEGAIPDEVQPNVNGFLVQQRNESDLANAMRLYIKDPNLAQNHGKNGRVLFEEKFTEEAFMDRMLSIFKELA